ncbi:CRISPR-associated endonuclease Cas1 [Conchiformibius kuhniae]|uniref:CRISPR-associated endonuclease Cas1 n=1 Tax=Conchiformibius kuhniae TaxID=211502 RepID=A0ABD8B8E0_9NEIS|nr:CRISPR-associated endonuclease Cas1 [Conchiformibius kuhniae]
MMTTLYIDRKNLRLTVENQAAVFYENDTRTATVPLHIIERICIKGSLQLNASVLGKLGEHGIGVLVLSGKQQQAALMMPNTKLDARRRTLQHTQAQDPEAALRIAKNLIAEKTERQAQLLRRIGQTALQHAHRLHRPAEQIQALVQAVAAAPDSDSLRGLEGAAAACYFQAWQSFLPASLNFQGRNRRPPRDPLNSILSLGYTLLHFEIVRHLHLCGLDPCIGFYHNLQHGRESLACDLLEPLRPQYDQWAIDLFRQHTLQAQDFSDTPQGCRLKKSGRLRYYRAYEEHAKTWRTHIHQACRRLLNHLCQSTCQPELALGELQLWDNPDAG